MTFGFQGGLSYISRLWYIDGKIHWQGWATRNLSKIRHPRAMPPAHVNTNGGLQWMLMSASRALFLCVLIPIWLSECTTPRGFSVRPKKSGSEGSLRWIWLPSLSSLMPCAKKKKSHCLQSCSWRWGSTCKSQLGFFVVFSPEFISGGNKLQSAPCTDVIKYSNSYRHTWLLGLWQEYCVCPWRPTSDRWSRSPWVNSSLE